MDIDLYRQSIITQKVLQSPSITAESPKQIHVLLYSNLTTENLINLKSKLKSEKRNRLLKNVFNHDDADILILRGWGRPIQIRKCFWKHLTNIHATYFVTLPLPSGSLTLNLFFISGKWWFIFSFKIASSCKQNTEFN